MKKVLAAVVSAIAVVAGMVTPASAYTLRYFTCGSGFFIESGEGGHSTGPFNVHLGQGVNVVVTNTGPPVTIHVRDTFGQEVHRAGTIGTGGSQSFHFDRFGAEPVPYRFSLDTTALVVQVRFDFNSYYCGVETGKVRSDLAGKCMRSYNSKAVIWDCGSAAAWTWGHTTSNGWDKTIRSSGQCLTRNGTSAGSTVIVSSCNPGAANQIWVNQADSTLFNPGTGLCLKAPASTNGTQLKIQTCNSASAQQRWTLPVQAFVV